VKEIFMMTQCRQKMTLELVSSIGVWAAHGFSRAARGNQKCGLYRMLKNPVSYQGIALAMPKVLRNQSPL
jgi:hypothetical protein